MKEIRRVNFGEASDKLASLVATEIEEKGGMIITEIDLPISSESSDTEELSKAYNKILKKIGTPWKPPQFVNQFTHIKPSSKADQYGTFGILGMAQHTDLPELPDHKIPPIMATACVKQSLTPARTTLVNLKNVWESIGEETQQLLKTELHYFEGGKYSVNEPICKKTNKGLIFRVTPNTLLHPKFDELRQVISDPAFHTTLTLQEGEMLVVTNGIGAVPMAHGRSAESTNTKVQSSKKRYLIRGFLDTIEGKIALKNNNL